jgi:hypothetical protein
MTPLVRNATHAVAEHAAGAALLRSETMLLPAAWGRKQHSEMLEHGRLDCDGSCLTAPKGWLRRLPLVSDAPLFGMCGWLVL